MLADGAKGQIQASVFASRHAAREDRTLVLWPSGTAQARTARRGGAEWGEWGAAQRPWGLGAKPYLRGLYIKID